MALYEELQEKKDEIQLNRKEVLTEVVKRYGSVRATALAVSCTTAQLYALLNGRRNIGDKLARSLEERLNMPTGTFDKPITKKVRVETEEVAITVKKIPVVSVVQAGRPTDNGDYFVDEYIEIVGEVPTDCFALRVTGDSMSPLIDEGDIVIVDPGRWPRPGDCIIARSELENLNEATIKRYYPTGFDETGRELFEARPFNDTYPVMKSVEQKLVIVGTVCKLIKEM